MFEDSLIESTGKHKGRGGLAAVISFGMQCLMLGVFVLAPLLYTDALPISSLKDYVQIPPPPGRAAPPAAQRPPAHHAQATEIVDNVLVQPHSIPTHIARIVDDRDAGPPGDQDGIPGMPAGFGQRSQFMTYLIATTSHNVAPPPPPTAQPAVRLSSGVTEGLLIQRITPEYPHLAKIGHIQGQVVLQAMIGKDGTIQNLQVVSGHPMLVRAAMDAVRRWRYRPYLLNHQPVEVDTQITVNFRFGG